LAIKQPLTTRQIAKNIINIPYFKNTSLSTTNKKARELEKHGYLDKTQTNQRVGGLTNYYELTPKFMLSNLLDSNPAKELFGNKSRDVSLNLLAEIINAQQDKEVL
jgi:hypothetical protein